MHKIYVFPNEAMYCTPKQGYLTMGIVIQTAPLSALKISQPICKK